ncbi:D-amino-acid oxidase [Cyphellophora attinorum]|uniref:D-amino-acid oxidase n=1 Tax=Cyphellophora attinorum TaxID=1664694 RepID=A0A0N1P1S6_9EURO|nr:D-amino-acid oxidase [Phialophora attinorum]KPI45665.1 D-amino-acid oxidase [Phialophora attinorum]
MAPSDPVIILGAGVTALTLAHQLLFPPSAPPNTTQTHHRPILILASTIPTSPHSTIPPSYASLWAGAHYRPIPASTPQLAFERELALRTHASMLQLASTYPETVSGIARIPAEEYLETDPDAATLALRTGDVYAGPGDDFHVLTADDLATLNAASSPRAEPVRWGCTYNTYCVNPALYLPFLIQRIQARGARIVQAHVDSFAHAVELARGLGFLPSHPGEGREAAAAAAGGGAPTIVDATGTGLLPDPVCRVIRGQTVLVKQQFPKTVTRQCRDGSWSFLIPRPGGGGTIVGGTKEIGDHEALPRRKTREGLLGRARAWFLGEFVGRDGELDVVGDIVGFRPWREGGVRLEAELTEVVMVKDVSSSSSSSDSSQKGQGVADTETVRVVYGYGLGGRGYELSWGVAERLVELVDGRASGGQEYKRAIKARL